MLQITSDGCTCRQSYRKSHSWGDNLHFRTDNYYGHEAEESCDVIAGDREEVRTVEGVEL